MKYLVALALLLSLSSAHAQNIGGIGAQLLLDTTGGTTMPRIASLIPNSPAYAQLNATDYIYKVNDIPCKDKTIEEVVGMIRGEVGTHVKITVADTKEGKRPRDFDLVRVGIQGVAPLTPPDLPANFIDWCDKEAQRLQMQGHTIIKTFNSACGSRYFNFEALPKQYHVRVMAMEEKKEGTPAFSITGRLFNNDNESETSAIHSTDPKSISGMVIATAEGDMTFKKECIGVVNVQVLNDITKCTKMYVIVYR